MAKNPKVTEEKLEKALNAWEALAPTKTFAGMTFEEFKAKIARSLDSRKRIELLQDQLSSEQVTRNDADKENLEMVRRVVNSILSDVSEGPDSDLYEAMGYVRRSERKSGLTQKKKKPAASKPAAS